MTGGTPVPRGSRRTRVPRVTQASVSSQARELAADVPLP